MYGDLTNFKRLCLLQTSLGIIGWLLILFYVGVGGNKNLLQWYYFFVIDRCPCEQLNNDKLCNVSQRIIELQYYIIYISFMCVELNRIFFLFKLLYLTYSNFIIKKCKFKQKILVKRNYYCIEINKKIQIKKNLINKEKWRNYRP